MLWEGERGFGFTKPKIFSIVGSKRESVVEDLILYFPPKKYDIKVGIWTRTPLTGHDEEEFGGGGFVEEN